MGALAPCVITPSFGRCWQPAQMFPRIWRGIWFTDALTIHLIGFELVLETAYPVLATSSNQLGLPVLKTSSKPANLFSKLAQKQVVCFENHQYYGLTSYTSNFKFSPSASVIQFPHHIRGRIWVGRQHLSKVGLVRARSHGPIPTPFDQICNKEFYIIINTLYLVTLLEYY